MRKLLLTLLLLSASLTYISAQKAPIVIQFNAGSRAPEGTVQSLLIDAAGHCTYSVDDVTGASLSQTDFSIKQAQVDSLLKKAYDLGFFKLQEQYRKGYDGSGIFVSMNYAGQKHHVDVTNTSVPEINTLVNVLNTMIASKNIKINYITK